MTRAAACVGGAGDIDSLAAFLDEDDFALLIDDECCAIGDSTVRHQDAIGRGSFTGCKIAEEWEGKRKLLGKFTLGGTIIGADSENLRFSSVKLGDTSLVSGEFAGSTTGEGRREEGHDNSLLSAKIGELDFAALGRG